MPVPAASYSLSSVFKALGLRDPRVIPALNEGGIQGSVSFGTFDALVSEVVEARTLVNQSRSTAIPNGQWESVQMLSVAPGGTIVEFLGIEADPADPSPFTIVNIGNTTAPFVPNNTIPPFSMGGQPAQNIFFNSGLQAGVVPLGTAFGGSTASGFAWPIQALAQGPMFERIWIPPGWSFWIVFSSSVLIGQTMSYRMALRSREIPQALGAA